MPTFSVSVYEREGSPYWWAKCYVAGEGGKPRRWSTGVRVGEGGRRGSRRLAAKRAEEQAARLAAVAHAPAPENEASVFEVAKRMLRQKEADGRRTRAVDSLAHVLKKHVTPFFGAARDVRTIRRADLEAFKRHLRDKGLEPVTVNNCLTGIRQVLKYAANVDEILESIPHVANVRVSTDGKGRALTGEQVGTLLASLDPRSLEARQYLQFVANTGMRKTETLAMRWGWIDWDRRVLRIPGEYRKGGRGHALPLNEEALSILEARRDRGTKYTGSVKRPLPTGPGDRVWLQVKHDEARNSAAERAGLGRVRTHDLRHTYGSLQHAAGTPLPEVRDLLGHKTMAMVNRYAHAYQERLYEAANRVQIVCPVPVPTEGSDRAQFGPDWARSEKTPSRRMSK